MSPFACTKQTTNDYGKGCYCMELRRRNKGIRKLLFGEIPGCSEIGKLTSRYSCPYYEKIKMSKPPKTSIGG